MFNHGLLQAPPVPQCLLTHDVELDTVADRIYELALEGDPVPLDLHARGMSLGIDPQAIINQAEDEING